MKPTERDLEAALRAASAALPAGDALLILIVATPEGDAAVISSASNIDAPSTRRRLLESELQREDPT